MPFCFVCFRFWFLTGRRCLLHLLPCLLCAFSVCRVLHKYRLSTRLCFSEFPMSFSGTRNDRWCRFCRDSPLKSKRDRAWHSSGPVVRDGNKYQVWQSIVLSTYSGADNHSTSTIHSLLHTPLHKPLRTQFHTHTHVTAKHYGTHHFTHHPTSHLNTLPNTLHNFYYSTTQANK